jgi:hypothetical protein
LQRSILATEVHITGTLACALSSRDANVCRIIAFCVNIADREVVAAGFDVWGTTGRSPRGLRPLRCIKPGVKQRSQARPTLSQGPNNTSRNNSNIVVHTQRSVPSNARVRDDVGASLNRLSENEGSPGL